MEVWEIIVLEGAGGSGWVFTESNYNAGYTSQTYTGGSWGLDTQYFLESDAYTIPGNMTMPNPSGGTMQGKSGNGHARITLVEEENIIELKLNGDEEVSIKLGNSYEDEGAILTKNRIDISEELIITGSVNVNVAGIYTITYSYYDEDIMETYSVTRTVTVIPIENEFNYTGAVQKFIVPVTGKYLLEVWGADGGAVNTSTYNSRGGYSKGIVELTEGEEIYVYVGGKGEDQNIAGINQGGFNGGGSAKTGFLSNIRTGGGGASDIRVLQDSLYNRIIVSGGGGGNSAHSTNMIAGNGGGPTGANGGFGKGGSQTEGGSGQVTVGIAASFGIGGSDVNSTVGGGGGGWYGGGNGNGAGRRIWLCFNQYIC